MNETNKIFKLKLLSLDNTKSRIALYDPYNSILKWEDSDLNVVETSLDINIDRVKVHAISPENPGSKIKNLRRIKLQLGFACNFSCSYCSQNNQRNFFKDSARKTLEKAGKFFDEMPNWFDGGEDGLGQNTFLEFWGGETLLYWDSVKELTIKIRARYPNMYLTLFTNGSLIKKEMADFASTHRLQFVFSHDGPTFSEDRGKDPLDDPKQFENVSYLFHKLNPLGLISFNATVSKKNFSLLKIRQYIADKLKVDPKEIYLAYDLATPYDQQGVGYVVNQEQQSELIENIFQELKKIYPFNLSVGMLNRVFNDFYGSLSGQRKAEFVGQKCEMDLPTSIAVDIDGNVLTCQNVNVGGGHKVGEVKDIENVKLNTAYHWSNRKECVSCPVVQICKGACMFLKDDLWTSACDQHFTWGLAYLSFMLYAETGMKIAEISSDRIRNDNVTQINLNW